MLSASFQFPAKLLKMKLIIVALCSLLVNNAIALNNLLHPRDLVLCTHGIYLGFQTVSNYFKDQHSLTIIDFTNYKVVDLFACSNGNQMLPTYVFDEWNKVNLGEKIKSSGLSPYPTTRGFYLKCLFRDYFDLFHVISKFNPRAKLLISLEDGGYGEAKKLLEVAWMDHKILNVAVTIFFNSLTRNVSDPIISLCLCNPFENDVQNRQPNFKCFNNSKSNAPFDEIEQFIKLRVTNLHQYPLRVDIFDEPLLSQPVLDENGVISHYQYADGDTVATIASKMNFKPIYKDSKDESRFGFKLPNGTFTGTLGAIENGDADIGAIAFLIADYKTHKTLFLQPIAMKSLYFVIQKLRVQKMSIISVFFQLDSFSKTIVGTLIMTFLLLYPGLNRIEADILNDKNQKPMGRNIFYVFALMSSVSMKHSTLSASRIVAATILFFTLLFSTIFQGSITRNLNRNEHEAGIASVKELLELDFNLVVEKSLVQIITDQGGSELGEKLRILWEDPSHIVESADKGMQMVLRNKKVAFLSVGLVSNIVENTIFDKTTGENLLEIIPTPMLKFYVSPLAPKDSPFIVSRIT